MLQLDNRTPFQAERGVLLDLDGSEIWVVAVKATFDIKNGDARVADEQEPVCMADKYYGEPGASGLKYENELVFRKPATDFVIGGHAWAPNELPVVMLDASIRIDGKTRTIRVFGDRVWMSVAGDLSPSSPEPFIKMPLIYERAYGGLDLSSDDPKKHGAEYRNPIGTGFAMSRAFLKDKPLPNLEDPANEIRTWKDRPKPVGFGFICRHWQPRRSYAGTYDQDWIENRMPLYPGDFDLRYFLGANPDFVFDSLRGGEAIELENLTPNGYLAFRLPRVALGFRTRLDGQWIEHRATLGSVFLEPDIPRVMLTWQTFLPCHRKKLYLDVTRIYQKEVLSWN